MQNEYYQAIKSLRRNEKILITRPDKGSGVVILNKNDYVTKMGNILNDASKIKCLGPAATADKTATIETKLQNRLRELLNSEQLLNKSMMRYALRVRKDRECTDCLKHTRKARH